MAGRESVMRYTRYAEKDQRLEKKQRTMNFFKTRHLIYKTLQNGLFKIECRAKLHHILTKQDLLIHC